MIRPKFFRNYWLPEELGLPFRLAKRIYIERCGVEGTIHGAPLGIFTDKLDFVHYIRAHTHTCVEDKSYGYICFLNRLNMLKLDGTPTSTAWHEYGHLLDVNAQLLCSDHLIKEDNFDKFQDAYHGKSFESVLRKIGHPEALGEYFIE